MSSHRSAHRKFGRVSKQRKALFRALTTSLIEHGRIQTTEAKAKDLRPIVESLVTKARIGGLANIRIVASYLYTEVARKKLFDVIVPAIGSRPGGYLRIMKNGFRPGDATPSAIIEFVDTIPQSQTSN